jgi:5-methyltetrahydropteroyltriglutamate--homocysteine methyltransferase
MKRSTERVLTTHTGSLPRSEDLAAMLIARAKGEPVDDAALQERVRSATAEVVRRQVQAGVDVISDGEAGKSHFIDYVSDRLTGFSDPASKPADAEEDTSSFSYFDDLAEFPDIVQATYSGTVFRLLVCTGEVGYPDLDEIERDIAYLKEALAQSPVSEAFMPSVSPGCVAQSLPNAYYDSYEDYVLAIAAALNREYKAITDAGLLVQLDAPDIGTCGNLQTWTRPEVDSRGIRWLQDLHVEAINVGLDGIPPERARLHICWANYQGPHTHDLPLGEALAPTLRANVAAISFEAANPAHAHEWELFEDFELPEDKVIIPGVIDTKTQVVENPRLVAQRLVKYAKLVGQERVIGGTDCGFGTAVGAPMVHPKVAWMKLQALAQGAAMATDDLSRT